MRRYSDTIPGTRAVHPGQRWTERDLSGLLPGCGCKGLQYHGSRQAGLGGLEVAGEQPMPARCAAMARARSYDAFPRLTRCRRADRMTSSTCTWSQPRVCRRIPQSLQSRPPLRCTSPAVPQARLACCGTCWSARATARGPLRRCMAISSRSVLHQYYGVELCIRAVCQGELNATLCARRSWLRARIRLRSSWEGYGGRLVLGGRR